MDDQRPTAPAETPAVVRATLARVAAGDRCMLLPGETGAGKEVAADRLHPLSPRRDHPLVKLDGGALRVRPIDLRFVAATNRDLAAEAASGVGVER